MFKNKTVIFFTFLILTTIIACKSQEKNNTSSTIVPSPLFIKMEKTPCYGPCPSYVIEIFKDGLVSFEGKRFVELIGKYKSTLSTEDIETIKNKVLEVNYFELEDTYDSPATDIPSCITQVSLNNKTKKITDRRYGPEELKDLEKLIEETVLKSNLIKIGE